MNVYVAISCRFAIFKRNFFQLYRHLFLPKVGFAGRKFSGRLWQPNWVTRC